MSIKPSILHRKYIYSIIFLLWSTGTLFLINRFFNNALFSSLVPRNTMQYVFIEIHAGISLISLILIGSLINHFFLAWKIKKSRFTGIVMIFFFAVLTITAWGLYYFSNDYLREGAVYLHSLIGLLFPILLIGHVYKK